MNHLTWTVTEGRVGPETHYGMWDGAKAFAIHYKLMPKGYHGPMYCLQSNLPGFRKDLPLQRTIDEAKAFAERMLTRWVAKRGLLFKAHIIVTDAMVKAAEDNAPTSYDGSDAETRTMIEAALKARG